jgi:hypothetical protein
MACTSRRDRHRACGDAVWFAAYSTHGLRMARESHVSADGTQRMVASSAHLRWFQPLQPNDDVEVSIVATQGGRPTRWQAAACNASRAPSVSCKSIKMRAVSRMSRSMGMTVSMIFFVRS